MATLPRVSVKVILPGAKFPFIARGRFAQTVQQVLHQGCVGCQALLRPRPQLKLKRLSGKVAALGSKSSM